MTTKELIRAEIRKWQSNIEAKCPESTSSRNYTKEEWNAIYEYNAYTRILSFLDTLPDEPASDDLKEVAEEYSRQVSDGHNYRDLTCGFIAGAKWQKDKDTRDMYMSDNRHFQKVYELGKKDMKEQMMKDAVECSASVCKLADKVWVTPNDEKKFNQDVFDHFIAGDKVKVIIVKED